MQHIQGKMYAHRVQYCDKPILNAPYVLVKSANELAVLVNNTELSTFYSPEQYNEEYFLHHALIFCSRAEGSGSISHSLKDIAVDGNTAIITITREVPVIGTCDMASWILVVETDAEPMESIHDIVVQYE